MENFRLYLLHSQAFTIARGDDIKNYPLHLPKRKMNQVNFEEATKRLLPEYAERLKIARRVQDSFGKNIIFEVPRREFMYIYRKCEM